LGHVLGKHRSGAGEAVAGGVPLAALLTVRRPPTQAPRPPTRPDLSLPRHGGVPFVRVGQVLAWRRPGVLGDDARPIGRASAGARPSSGKIGKSSRAVPESSARLPGAVGWLGSRHETPGARP